MSEERRKRRRVPVRFPVRISGTNESGNRFEEMSSTIDVSSAGLKFPMKAAVKRNDIFTVSLPLPREMRPVPSPDPVFTCRVLVARIEESAAKPGEKIIIARFVK